MPKRTDIQSILIIGAGPIVIGQACEFDYSGAQACKALREEGYRVILVNSNPATIMTDPAMADSTYIEPITWQTVAQIIEKEQAAHPGEKMAVLPTMGGQTALNCALALDANGVLEQFGVELIGASKDAIEMAEDRKLFDQAMRRIGLECPRAAVAGNMQEAFEIQAQMGYPCIIRPSFTMGGSGGGIFGSIGSWIASQFHDGGVVGASSAPQRVVPAHLFANAPRYHNGLMPDEFPAILQRGETVVPKGKSMGGMNITFNVNTPNAQSFMDSQGQMMAKLAGSLQRYKARNG